MAEFECKSGYCVKCCTDIGIIPVSIGDLYRTWFYRQKTGERTSFHNVFKELCNDWTLVPSADGSVHAMPNSKMPCRNVDIEEKKCSVYDTTRYVTCASFPEDWLLDIPGLPQVDYSLSMEFINGLECFKDVTLSPERKEEILKLRDLIDRETYLTTKFLQADVYFSSVVGDKPSKRVQRELFSRIKFIGENKHVLRTVRENLIRNNILQDYEKLVLPDNSSGFSFCEEI